MSKSRVVSVTLPEPLYRRLLEQERKRGRRERSKIVQEALRSYFGTQGADPAVVKRWEPAYARAGGQEARAASSWAKAQSASLGEP